MVCVCDSQSVGKPSKCQSHTLILFLKLQVSLTDSHRLFLSSGCLVSLGDVTMKRVSEKCDVKRTQSLSLVLKMKQEDYEPWNKSSL